MIPRRLFSDEHESFRASFRKFLEKEVIPQHEAWEERGYVDREVWQKAGENGFLCPSMPEQYGGSGADRLYSMVMMEETAKARTSGLGFSLHSEIVARYILTYGTEAQKQAWLPRMARGELVGAIAMTEPFAGSDLQAINNHSPARRRSVRHQRLEDVHHERLDRRHRLPRGEDLIPRAPGGRGISLVVVEPKGLAGYTVGQPLEKVGLQGQDTCELFFDNMRIPVVNLLGPAEGSGFSQMMEQLPYERLLISVHAPRPSQAGAGHHRQGT